MNLEVIDVKFDNKNLFAGLVLVILGIIAPVFLNTHNFMIYDLLYLSINKNDTGILIMCALRLVLLNSLRGLPHYLGTFIISESISVKIKNKTLPHIKGFIGLLVIPIVYSLINTIHNIKYDLGVPAFLIIFAIILLENIDFNKINIPKKALIIIIFLFGVQWLDIIPELSILKFGRGETSQDIKAVASILDGEEILSIFGSFFFVLFITGSILVAKLISDENKIIVANEIKNRVEQELYESKMNALQARYYSEIKNLVHDLKTPITSSIALIGVIKMMNDSSNHNIQNYLEKIETSLDNQSEMISEILNKDKRKTLTSEELVNYIFSHISHLPYSKKVVYNNLSKEKLVNVNKINFTRAIINILDNSYNALDKENGQIWINVYSQDRNIFIEITDNGIGIKEEMMNVIDQSGFSSRKSTGLGLTFIKDVIDDHNGEIIMKSEYGVGTTTKIILSEVI